MAPQKISSENLLNLTQPTIVIILLGRLGDIVACEPVIPYLKRAYPGKKIAWVVQENYIEMLVAHPQLDYLVVEESQSDAYRLTRAFPAHIAAVNLHLTGNTCPKTGDIIDNGNNKNVTRSNLFHWGSLLEALAFAAHLPRISDAPKFYLSPAVETPPLPEKYIVFHCKSNKVAKDWPAEKWNTLFKYFEQQRMPVVEVGLEPVLATTSEWYHDMTHLRSIQSIAQIIAQSTFFFGIDSGFAHIANALDINGIVVMGKYKKFTHYVPYTGKYKYGHIIRKYTEPPGEVPCEDVIRKYEAMIADASYAAPFMDKAMQCSVQALLLGKCSAKAALKKLVGR